MTEITVCWANDEQTIVLCTYPVDGWTQEDTYQAMALQREMIEISHVPVVDVIVDSRAIRWLPIRLSFKKGVDKVAELKHPRQGITVFVVAWKIPVLMAQVMLSLIDRQGREFFFVNTMEEALEKVAEVTASRRKETR